MVAGVTPKQEQALEQAAAPTQSLAQLGMVPATCRLTGPNVIEVLTIEVTVTETVEAGAVTVVRRKLLQSLLAIAR